MNSAQVIKDHFNYHNSFQLAYLFKIRSQGLKRKRQMMRHKWWSAVKEVGCYIQCDVVIVMWWSRGGLVMWSVKKGGAPLLPPLPPITDILNGGEQLGLGDGNICYVNLGRDGAHPLVGVACCAEWFPVLKMTNMRLAPCQANLVLGFGKKVKSFCSALPHLQLRMVFMTRGLKMKGGAVAWCQARPGQAMQGP